MGDKLFKKMLQKANWYNPCKHCYLSLLSAIFAAVNTKKNPEQLLSTLPDKPGVYQFYNKEGEIIYIGKAKSLRKRVRSYFNKDRHESGKTAFLVKRIHDIKCLIVDTEFDALLLENNLIKKYLPKYNIQLKDDKSFPWIRIKKERFPRVFSTRTLVKDGSEYFGPYANVKVMNTVLELIKQLYPLRNCNYDLSEENIKKKKFKVCLEYHLGNCLGPCEELQNEKDYLDAITEIKHIMKGNIHTVSKKLKELMKTFSENLEFEKAQFIKQKLERVEKFQSKSLVVNPSIKNVDVFSIREDEKYGYVNYLKVVNGAIIQGHTVEMKKKLDESLQELLSIAITNLRERFESDAKEIIIPLSPEIDLPETHFTIPQIGDKKKLLELSERNLSYYVLEKQKQVALIDPDRHKKRILKTAMKDLRMKEVPMHIECFDNSNMQGAFPVAACVVFKNAKPSKKDYRHFNIKTVEGPDDFASMEEVIYRRYKRLTEEKLPLPQLIIIDGGKGQLSAALKSLEKLGLRGKIAIIGIAKKLEEIYFPGDSIPLYIDKKSETLKLIQQLRNEAHRFGITHHRKQRSKGTIKSELTEIKGISTNTAQKLLWAFKSVKNIKVATEEKMAEYIGPAKARLVFDHFHPEEGR